MVRTSSFHVEDTGSIPVGDSTHSRPGRHIHCGVIARSVGWSSLRLFDRSAGWKRGSLPLSLQARREPLLRSIHSSLDVPALSRTSDGHACVLSLPPLRHTSLWFAPVLSFVCGLCLFCFLGMAPHLRCGVVSSPPEYLNQRSVYGAKSFHQRCSKQ